MSNSEIYNIRNAGMKQEISDMKNDLMKLLDIIDLVAESLSKIKDSITEALHEENSLLHQKIEKLDSRISVLEIDSNKQDQYNRRNHLDIQGIPGSVPDDQLEEKVIKIFNQINVKINTFHIEDCHRMGKSKKTNIVRFVNRKNCKAVLEKKVNLK